MSCRWPLDAELEPAGGPLADLEESEYEFGGGEDAMSVCASEYSPEMDVAVDDQIPDDVVEVPDCNADETPVALDAAVLEALNAAEGALGAAGAGPAHSAAEPRDEAPAVAEAAAV